MRPTHLMINKPFDALAHLKAIAPRVTSATSKPAATPPAPAKSLNRQATELADARCLADKRLNYADEFKRAAAELYGTNDDDEAA